MDELISVLPSIIIYLALGFCYIKVYKFTRIIKSDAGNQNLLVESLIFGFVLRNLLGLIPVSFGKYIDVIGMIVFSVIAGYLTAKAFESKWLNKIRSFLKINQTFNKNIWGDIADENGATYITVVDDNNIFVEGLLVLHEPHKSQPLMQLAKYKVYNGDDLFIDYSEDPERTILIDTTKYKGIFITYEKCSDKTNRWKNKKLSKDKLDK